MICLLIGGIGGREGSDQPLHPYDDITGIHPDVRIELPMVVMFGIALLMGILMLKSVKGRGERDDISRGRDDRTCRSTLYVIEQVLLQSEAADEDEIGRFDGEQVSRSWFEAVRVLPGRHEHLDIGHTAS